MIPSVSPAEALNAYARATAIGPADSGTDPASGTEFGQVLQRSLQGVIDAGHEADRQSATAIAGGNNITEVVMAVSKAELALQATTAIRDRVVQAYQDIMHMAI